MQFATLRRQAPHLDERILCSFGSAIFFDGSSPLCRSWYRFRGRWKMRQFGRSTISRSITPAMLAASRAQVQRVLPQSPLQLQMDARRRGRRGSWKTRTRTHPKEQLTVASRRRSLFRGACLASAKRSRASGSGVKADTWARVQRKRGKPCRWWP